jgi:hypothetical protein
MDDDITEITTDWAGNPIGIGTMVNVDNGGNVKNKSGAVTEVIFKGETRDDIYLRVTGVKNLTSLQYVTVLVLSELEQVVYEIFTKNGANIGVPQLREATQRILEVVNGSDEP